MKRAPYQPPRLSSLGTFAEPIEHRGEELAVRLTEAFFELPPEAWETVLRLVMAGARERNRARHELVLCDRRHGRRIGGISAASGLQLSGR